jgi:hypothetical protein
MISELVNKKKDYLTSSVVKELGLLPWPTGIIELDIVEAFRGLFDSATILRKISCGKNRQNNPMAYVFGCACRSPYDHA